MIVRVHSEPVVWFVRDVTENDGITVFERGVPPGAILFAKRIKNLCKNLKSPLMPPKNESGHKQWIMMGEFIRHKRVKFQDRRNWWFGQELF